MQIRTIKSFHVYKFQRHRAKFSTTLFASLSNAFDYVQGALTREDKFITNCNDPQTHFTIFLISLFSPNLGMFLVYYLHDVCSSDLEKRKKYKGGKRPL